MKYFNTDFTLNNCLFGSVKLTKETDLDKYKYTGYETGFDSRGYSLSDGSVGKNAIIFRVDMSSSVHIDNKGKDIKRYPSWRKKTKIRWYYMYSRSKISY